jgi:hypothetical protein
LALEVLPGASRIGPLVNVGNPAHALFRRNAEAAAASFERKLVPVEVRVPDDLDAAFEAMVRAPESQCRVALASYGICSKQATSYWEAALVLGLFPGAA